MSISNIYSNNDIASLTDFSIVQCPKEIVIDKICRYLNNARDVVRLALTNRKFCSLVLNNSLSAPLWNLFLRKDFSNSYTAPKSETESLPLYQRLKNAAHNMEVGKCRSQILDRHQDVIACMTTLDGELISGSWDNTIKIWDL